MTANARVEIAKRDEVVRVPNAALRFRPSAETFATLDQDVPDDLQAGGSRVWVVADGKLQAVRVKVGITDGVNSEIVGGELPEHAQLATGMATSAATSTAVNGRGSNGSSRNPLMGVGGDPRGR